VISSNRKLMTYNPQSRNSATKRSAREIVTTNRARYVILERMD